MTPEDKLARSAWICALLAVAIVPINFGVWLAAVDSRRPEGWLLGLMTLLAMQQFALGLVALIQGVRLRRRRGHGGVGAAVVGTLAALGAPLGWALGIIGASLGSMGGAWGRPLRIRGRQLHPSLREGSDWTRGPRPDPRDLDEPTRRALQALWLHDAQKEHASVPAFSRISWMLAAVGAPADLLQWCHRAALEEIEHTQLCFALAAGYGRRSHSVQAMPELLVGGLDVQGDPLVALAVESLSDGCQLEDFNADVAAACAVECIEPATLAVLSQVAREERSHAEFSWALVAWLLERDRDRIEPALRQAQRALDDYRRPTAVSWDKRGLVRQADDAQLRAHGRLPDARWGQLWDERLEQTRRRLDTMLGPAAHTACA
jgi:hypothetical protein